MSHPDPGRTYEEDTLDRYSKEELAGLWEMYVEESKHKGVKADLSQFSVWIEDRE